jgi:hypothetical protein
VVGVGQELVTVEGEGMPVAHRDGMSWKGWNASPSHWKIRDGWFTDAVAGSATPCASARKCWSATVKCRHCLAANPGKAWKCANSDPVQLYTVDSVLNS